MKFDDVVNIEFLEPPYRYRVIVRRVIDGDTVVVDLDHGRNLWSRNVYCRLYGINTPEMTGESRDRGRIAREHLVRLIDKYSLGPDEEDALGIPSWTLIATTHKDVKGKYGRDLVILWGRREDGQPINLNKEMFVSGNAEEYYV